MVGRNDLSGVELRIGIRGIDDQLLAVVDDGKGREAVAGAELIGPACADRVWATDMSA